MTVMARKTPPTPIQDTANINPAMTWSDHPAEVRRTGRVQGSGAACQSRADDVHRERLAGWDVERKRDSLDKRDDAKMPHCQDAEQAEDSQGKRAEAQRRLGAEHHHRRGNRSAATPPSGASTSIGRPLRLFTIPRSAAEPDSVSAA